MQEIAVFRRTYPKIGRWKNARTKGECVLAASVQEYERMVMRMPGVISARVFEEDDRPPRIHVVSEAVFTPRQIVRQVVSLVRNMGWTDASTDMVSVVQIQRADDGTGAGNRLRIFGYSVKREANQLHGRCRLGRASAQFEGDAYGGVPTLVVAGATVAAVNQILGQPLLTLLDVKIVSQVGHSVVLTMIRFGEKQMLTGSAIVRGVLEETVVRATLDAVNRRVVLYTGTKPD